MQCFGYMYTENYLLLIQDSGLAGHCVLYLVAWLGGDLGEFTPIRDRTVPCRAAGRFLPQAHSSPIQKAAKPVGTQFLCPVFHVQVRNLKT